MRISIVTGASSGLGREFVRQLDETISLGAKKILEVKQKKSADSSVL